MELRGPLASLRQDHIEWERGQQALSRALAAWRAEPVVAPVLAAMKRFGAGAPLERCSALALLFDPASGRALAFSRSLADAGLAALDGNPLGQLPLSHGSRDAAPLLVLAQSGGARLTLSAYDGAALALLPAARTARFRPVENWALVLVGSCKGDRALRDDEGGLSTELCAFTAGDLHYRHGPNEAVEVRSIDGSMAVLQLERQLDEHEPVREYALADGALVHQASARKEDSRAELAMALLGRMNRIDAVPQMARAALGGGGDAMRWQALREVIVLDGLAGMELLAQVAADPEDSLGVQAGALLEQLLASRPDLQGGAAWPG